MLPYSHLDIPHGLITHRLQQFVVSSNLINTGKFLNRVEANTVHKAIPELRDLFAQYNLNDFYVMFIARAKCGQVPTPHRDVKPLEEQQEPTKAVAVNWPIINCNNTFTAFYDQKHTDLDTYNKNTLENGLDYLKYNLNQVVETHRIKIEVPTAIRYDCIHSIINDTNQDRLTASFRFDSDHWELFEK